MPEESGINDPYELVLKDLYAKRDQILGAIAAIESMRGGGSAGTGTASGGTTSKPDGGGHDLLGMSIVDAAKKLLATKRKPLRNPDLAALFKEGGLVLNSREPANTIGSVLTRRFADIGDVVRVERGTWGLKEWYPNRSFKAAKTEASAPEPPRKEHWKTRQKREREEAAARTARGATSEP